MKKEIYHNGDLLETSNISDDSTPETCLEFFLRYNGKFGYDIMIGNIMYNIKSCKWADNKSKIVVKVTRNLRKGLRFDN